MRALMICLLLIVGAMALCAQTSAVPTTCGSYQTMRVTVDGSQTPSMGIIRRGRTYLPARQALQRAGASMDWAGSQNSFYVHYPGTDTAIRVKVGSPVVRVYRYDAARRYGAGTYLRSVRLSNAPFQCGREVYVPVRTVIGSIGGTVDYDRTARVVSVHPPPMPPEGT